MKSKFLITIICLIGVTSFAQKNITWDDLADVEFETKFFPAYEGYFLYPYFSPSIIALEGSRVTITGYFLDIDPKGKLFILSKGPMSACFFCGIGGPETAMELQFDSKPKFKLDDILSVTGILKLNRDDVMHFNYILTDVEAKLKNE
ncbi:hypothetical protein [Psychroserpens sp.]|uniref:hypothetical protein n=1 Tax=Psychroserpens sp. TaxID=2020870 RepID=UPI001B089474|nr:hypothetical protein [Psychroserpens sp.]MBO6607639.1 hypothetical protein [Psychroserpens sp.]MBO6631418.1 hypothetical protein [Psychroserpens sp.]MBO6655049.1 hypothetical protein [Psychroserpens sp.]MBO6683146.1 hypothetical protein [Psychroserpens sp.]MBO6749675.1 hypothetical protein [Psychroserpens sp.]